MIKKPLVEAAARLGITLSVAVVTGKADRAGYERVFDAMEKDQVDGLSVGENSENLANRVLIVELAARHRLPAIYPWREFVGKHNEEVQLYAFDVLALDGDDLRGLPLSMRKTNLARLLARRPDGIFVAPFELGEIGPDLFRAACNMGLEGLVSKRGTGLIGAAGRSTGSEFVDIIDALYARANSLAELPERHLAILINKYGRLFVYLGAVWAPDIAESSQCGFDRMGYETPSLASHPASQRQIDCGPSSRARNG